MWNIKRILKKPAVKLLRDFLLQLIHLHSIQLDVVSKDSY